MDDLRAHLKEAGQEHLLQYLDAGMLSPEESSNLLDQIKQFDMKELKVMLEQTLNPHEPPTSCITPIENLASTLTSPPQQLEEWRRAGLDAIREGKVAAVVLSGGQGTRLGFDGPKGMYSIGMPSGKSIFQLLAERILRLSSLAQTSKNVPLYVMTSPMNQAVTKAFFADHQYFGMDPSEVVFFNQGTLPCFGLDGKILLESPSSLALAPDGNGGIYVSMRDRGVIDDMQRRGVEYLHVFAVDNVLVKVADPVFIGFCASRGADCGNKVVWKSHWGEKVGVVVQRGGKPCVVEYSEMDPQTCQQTDASGKLVFGAGNICNHFYTLSFIRDRVLPNLHGFYHAAKKKIPHVDYPSTTVVKPTKENGYKLEAFIFDPFPFSENMALLEVAREDEFAPVKDAPGGSGDTPDKARSMLSSQARRWMEAAGAKLGMGNDSNDSSSAESDVCEISPLVSYGGEGLEEHRGKEIKVPFAL